MEKQGVNQLIIMNEVNLAIFNKNLFLFHIVLGNFKYILTMILASYLFQNIKCQMPVIGHAMVINILFGFV